MNQPAKSLITWGSRILFAALVAGIVAVIAVLLVIPRVTNGAALTVLTGSMTPEIPVGSVVVIRPVDPGTLKVGDVATYQAAPGKDVYITHRVARIDDSTSPATFVFKGDANRGEDTDPVPAAAIRGKVWFHVPLLGAARDALQGTAGLGLLAMLVLSTYAVSQLVSALRERKQQPRPEQAPRSADDVVARLDQTLVVARFDGSTSGERGLEPQAAAQEWGGLVVEDDGTGFTLIIAPEPHLVDLLVDVLALHGPVRLEVVAGPVELRSRVRTTASAQT